MGGCQNRKNNPYIAKTIGTNMIQFRNRYSSQNATVQGAKTDTC